MAASPRWRRCLLITFGDAEGEQDEEVCHGSEMDVCRRRLVAAGHSRRRLVTAEPSKGPVFIAGDQPVTEDQVRQKLQSDGWSNVQVVREGRYLEAIGSKSSQTTKVAIDAQTGRLRAADDDDED